MGSALLRPHEREGAWREAVMAGCGGSEGEGKEGRCGCGRRGWMNAVKRR